MRNRREPAEQRKDLILGHDLGLALAVFADGELVALHLAIAGDILGPEPLTLEELTRRLDNGARFLEIPVRSTNGVQLAPEPELLFIVGANGAMRAATDHHTGEAQDGDTLVGLVQNS